MILICMAFSEIETLVLGAGLLLNRHLEYDNVSC